MSKPEPAKSEAKPAPAPTPPTSTEPKVMPREIGGPPGPEPTRHGDWEFNGRCTDF